MSDFPARADWERRIERGLASAFAPWLDRLLALLGDPPHPDNVPASFWREVSADVAGELRPALESVWIASARDFAAGRAAISLDWSVINRRAARWAETYTYDLVKGIEATSRRKLQSAINVFFRDGLTKAQLEAKIAPLFGPVRAQMIAVTEVTRASVQGELATVREIRRANPGIALVPVWNTNNDELVCPICRPRNQTRQGELWYDPPPAHVLCRCWLNHVWTRSVIPVADLAL